MGETMTKELGNWIGGEGRPAAGGAQSEKRSPHDGPLRYRAVQSTAEDVDRAVTAARQAQPARAAVPAVRRGHLLHRVCTRLEAHRREIAEIAAADFAGAMALANDSPYGLTACIHTKSFDRAMAFTQQVRSGAPRTAVK